MFLIWRRRGSTRTGLRSPTDRETTNKQWYLGATHKVRVYSYVVITLHCLPAREIEGIRKTTCPGVFGRVSTGIVQADDNIFLVLFGLFPSRAMLILMERSERANGQILERELLPTWLGVSLSKIVLSRTELDKTKRAIAINSLLFSVECLALRTEFADPKPITDIPEYDRVGRGPG